MSIDIVLAVGGRVVRMHVGGGIRRNLRHPFALSAAMKKLLIIKL